MSTITQENLDERIERIRKLDAEIEKRHREAEADRLMALKDNAMVKTKAPNTDDWPKCHKYDTINFTYDEQKHDSDDKSCRKINGDSKSQNYVAKPNRDYKKFANGEGPPPDPTYNFLADAERDGHTDKTNGEWRSANNSGQSGGMVNNSRNKNAGNGGLNNSFRGRNNGGGGKGKQQNGSSNNTTNRYQRNDIGNDHNTSWKIERNDDHQRSGIRQKNDGNGGNKWRREWDTNKVDDVEILQKTEHLNINDGGQTVLVDKSIGQRSPIKNNSNNSGKQHHAAALTATGDLAIEKRGNIMVSVSQDGEVKSVKLTSAKAIGTGRVGPRQQTGKTQFSIHKEIIPPDAVIVDNTFGNQQQFHGNNTQQLHYQQQQQQQLQQQQHQLQQQHQKMQQLPLQIQQQQQFHHQQLHHQQLLQQQRQQQSSLRIQQVVMQQLQLQQQQQPHHHIYQSQTPLHNEKLYEQEIPIIAPRLIFDGRSNLQDRLNRHRLNAVSANGSTQSSSSSSSTSSDNDQTTGVLEQITEATVPSATSETVAPIAVGN